MTRLTTTRTGRRGPYVPAALLLAALGSMAGRAEATYYTITDLGAGSLTIAGTGINASGVVTGYVGGTGFVADHGPMTSIGTLPGGSASYAYGINDSGVVVGFSNTGSGAYDAFTYSNGTMTDVTATRGIALGGSTFNFATSINNSGQIAGYISSAAGTHAFLYNGTNTIDLGTLAGSTGTSHAQALNASGQVVGDATTSAGPTHAFLYSGGSMHDLGALGNPLGASVAYDINATGHVVGESIVNNTSTYHAFLYDGTSMTDLTAGAAYAGYNSQAFGINSSGAAVGYFGTSSFSSHGFLYSGGTLTDLNSLISPTSGWTITGAYAINDAGQIAALATNGQQIHTLLLTAPLLVPEPPTIALLCSGAVVGLGLRRFSRRIKAEDLAADPAAE
jgi:probable HAF family extracellular repeat protein